MKKAFTILIGFIHDFAAGYWLACIITIAFLDHLHNLHPEVTGLLNSMERFFFWNSVAAAFLIFAAGAGRTFTYVDKFYGADAERSRRRMLVVKHVVLLAIFAAGYFVAFGRAFH